MNFLSVRFILSIILSIILSHGVAYAQPQNIIIIGGDHNPPFRIIEGDKMSGIYGELIYEIVKGTGLEVRFKQVPYKRALAELSSGGIDVFLAFVKTPEREREMYYCKPYIKDRTDRAFYLRKGEGKRVKRYEDLIGLNIGLLLGINITPKFDNDKRLLKQEVPTHVQNFQKLINGRIDAIVHTEIAIDFQVKSLGYSDNLEKAPFRLTEKNPTYFVISRKSPFMSCKAEFEANLKRIARDGTFEKLVKKWTK